MEANEKRAEMRMLVEERRNKCNGTRRDETGRNQNDDSEYTTENKSNKQKATAVNTKQQNAPNSLVIIYMQEKL